MPGLFVIKINSGSIHKKCHALQMNGRVDVLHAHSLWHIDADRRVGKNSFNPSLD
jgi:hypothetical protein